LGDVISWNLRRRHLSEAQRASVGAKLANMPAHRPNKYANLHTSSVSRAQAAEMLNVSKRSVNTAKKIQEEAIPEIIEKVDVGDMSLRAAAIAAKLANIHKGDFCGNQYEVYANLHTPQVSRAQAAEMLNVSEQ
jgi:hypothetical protein